MNEQQGMRVPRLALPVFAAVLIALALALPAAASADFSLTVEAKGSGTGSWECEVEEGPAEPCEAEYPSGTELVVVAEADPGSEFVEFHGDCGPLACYLTMDENHTATVVFKDEEAEAFALNVEEPGSGSGKVQCEVNGGPAEECEYEYPEGTGLNLVAEADPGSGFLEWGGECDHIAGNECELEMDKERTVEVLFELEPSQFALNVEEPGSGEGSVECVVEAGPAEPCKAEYPQGTVVTAIAEAAPGSEFVEWLGECDFSAGVECEVEMRAERTVEAIFEAKPTLSLTIAKAGSGSGAVECKVNGGSLKSCEAQYPEGTELALVAKAGAGSTFAGYSAGTGSASACSTSPCAFTIEANSALTATFNLISKPKFQLTVTKSGTGAGKVTSTPSGIDCGGTCSAEFEEGKEIELKQAPEPGSEFKEWSGSCTGSGACKVTMSAAKSVGAKFDLIPKPKFKLTVTKSGTGAGTVTSTPGGISCGATCSSEYEAGKEVELKESAEAGSEFVKWGGACSGTGSCKVTMSEARSVSAEFKLLPKPKFKLSVTKPGSGKGTVTSTPAGINCGVTCSFEFEEGKVVELKPLASAGSKFTEWSGSCTGSGACKVTMSSTKAVGAQFDLIPTFKLSISKTGTGQGTVTSTPAGIACGKTCEAEFEEGKEIQLTATPDEGSEFKQWSGACKGSGSCKVTMSAAQSVTAVFKAAPTHRLLVTKSGTGSGRVRSAPPISAIDCGGACEAKLPVDTEVELIATPDPGSEFFKWSGACTGTGPCKVTMDSAKTAHATFKEVPKFKLSVNKAGSGTVTSFPAGIDCGTQCEYEYSAGTAITLSAIAAHGYRFKGWSGCDNATGAACTLRIKSPRTVTATFVLAKCKKGFHKGKVKGKLRCVRTKRRAFHRHGAATPSPSRRFGP